MERPIRNLHVLLDFLRDILVLKPLEINQRQVVRGLGGVIHSRVTKSMQADLSCLRVKRSSREPNECDRRQAGKHPKPFIAASGSRLARARLQWGSTEREPFLRSVLRPRLLQAYRNTEIWALLLQAEEAYSHGVILLSLDGRVEFASARAGDLMSQYLPSRSRRHRGELPDLLARWVRQQESLLGTAEDMPPLPEPLGIERDHRKLIVRFFPGIVQRLLLLEERVTSVALRALESFGLTRREAEVLTWLAEGKTNEEIATILGFSRRTAEKHVENILRKLGVENRTAAARVFAGGGPC